MFWFLAIITAIGLAIYFNQKAEFERQFGKEDGEAPKHGYNTAIVGESSYKKTIAKCFNKAIANSDSDEFENIAYCKVRLELEDSNKYDNKAVVVISKFGTVGYLSKANARKYRKNINENGKKANAKIYFKNSNYGIWIDLDLGR